MSAVDLTPIAAAPAKPKRMFRPATLIVWVLTLGAFLFVAQYVIDAGFVRRDIEALQAGEAWRTGGWLSQLVLSLVGLVPDPSLQQGLLSLTAAVLAGLAFGLLYDRLRISGWTIAGAALVLIAFACHAQVLYSITAASRGLPLYFAFAVLIPAIRQMEQVGDVQSTIGLGLLMPLVVLAGPLTTPLILPLALGAALADPDGRRDPRAFVAMLLVALLPALIVGIGVVGFVAQSGMGVENVILPYVATYGALQLGNPIVSVETMLAFAPVALVPLLYCVWPNLPERRHVWSALAVVAMPLYLALARVVFQSPMQAFVPAVALMAAYISWLCVARLPLLLRVVALAMLAVSVLTSWMFTDLWTDEAWRSALFSHDVLGGLALRPSL